MEKEKKILVSSIIGVIFGTMLGLIVFAFNPFFSHISKTVSFASPQSFYLPLIHVLMGLIVGALVGSTIGNIIFDIDKSRKKFDKLKEQHLNLMFFLEKQKWLPIIIIFAIIYFFWGTRIDLSLLFRDTIVTGGDTASWYQIADHLKTELIPHGRLFGWSNGNFFGYNELQHYFVPPFLLTAVLSIFFPLTISLKIVTVLGLFLIPLFFFISIKKITNNIWISLLGASLSLIFIFNESYTMYGGNFLSTLAGEFTYSFSLLFFVLFIGICYNTFVNNKNPIFAGLILGLIGLSHFFVFMPAFFVPFFFLIFRKPFFLNRSDPTNSDQTLLSKDLGRLLIVYATAIVLMAFWLIPMIATKGLTTPLSGIWKFNNFKTFFVSTFFTLTLIGFVVNFISIFFGTKKIKTISAFFFYMYAVSFFLYFIVPLLGIPNIRFIPPMLIISLFSIAIAIHTTLSLFDRKIFFPIEIYVVIIAICISFIFVSVNGRNVSSWFSWNNTGYEAKKGFPLLEKIAAGSGGTIDDGRLLWEKLQQADNVDFGSERAFENLYFFTGRPSAEGVLYGSSFMARSVTYMQSEYSQNPIDPEADRIYSKVNPKVWPYRFYQTNSQEIILFSDKLKKMFAQHSDFTHHYNAGKFGIYSFNHFPKSYIQVIEKDNISLVHCKYGFLKDFYRFFRDYELFDHPFIPTKFAGKLAADLKEFKNYDTYRQTLDKPLPPFTDWLDAYPYKTAISNETVTDFDINFTTDQVGKPHIIKISYSKNFKSRNGEKIYPISPGFMMIIPSTTEVSIYFGQSTAELLGLILSLLLIPILLLVIIFRKKITKFRLPFPRILYSTSIALVLLIAIVLIIKSFSSSHGFENNHSLAYKYFYQGKYRQTYDLIANYATTKSLNDYDNMRAYNYIVLREKVLVKLNKQNKYRAIKNLQDLMDRYRHSRANGIAQGAINEIRNY